MGKKLVYRFEVVCDPKNANPAGMIDALTSQGAETVEIVYSGMRKAD